MFNVLNEIISDLRSFVLQWRVKLQWRVVSSSEPDEEVASTSWNPPFSSLCYNGLVRGLQYAFEIFEGYRNRTGGY